MLLKPIGSEHAFVYAICLQYLNAGTSKTWCSSQVSLSERMQLVTYLVDGEISSSSLWFWCKKLLTIIKLNIKFGSPLFEINSTQECPKAVLVCMAQEFPDPFVNTLDFLLLLVCLAWYVIGTEKWSYYEYRVLYTASSKQMQEIFQQLKVREQFRQYYALDKELSSWLLHSLLLFFTKSFVFFVTKIKVLTGLSVVIEGLYCIIIWEYQTSH